MGTIIRKCGYNSMKIWEHFKKNLETIKLWSLDYKIAIKLQSVSDIRCEVSKVVEDVVWSHGGNVS